MIPYVKLKKESCRAATTQEWTVDHIPNLNRTGPQKCHMLPVLSFYRKGQLHDKS